MMEEQKDYSGRRRLILGIAFVALGLTLASLLYNGFHSQTLSLWYGASIITGLTVFWILTDIVLPVATHEFEDKTPEQMNAYKGVAVTDLAGYAGLVYFCLVLDEQRGFYGAIVYAISVMMKRRFMDDYRKDPAKKAKEAVENNAEGDTAEIETTPENQAAKEDSISAASGRKLSLHERAALAGADTINEDEEEAEEVPEQSGESEAD